MTILVGGVAQLYQGDLDFGRRVVAALADGGLGPEVVVEDLHYGAVAVAQRLEELRPEALILVGAERRGRPQGTLERRFVETPDAPPQELQRAVADAVTGYVTIDLVVEVGFALGALPPATVAIELEPVRLEPAERLSREAERRVHDAVGLVGAEVQRLRERVPPRPVG